MNDRSSLSWVAAIGAAALVWFVLSSSSNKPAPRPMAPSPAPLIQPAPKIPRAPRCPNCPAEAHAETWAGGIIGQDVEPAVDVLAMPSPLRRANIASKGLGCCVFRSIEYAAHWQNVPALYGFPEWMRSKNIEGGGIPSKVRALIPRIAADRSMRTPEYVQYEGNDPAIIELALKTGRLPAVTWGGNHMLSCTHLDPAGTPNAQAAILDNNSPERVQWMPRAKFLERWRQGSGGWVVVLLAPPPPPPPAGARQDAGYQWRKIHSDPQRVALFRASRQVGEYRYLTRSYHPLAEGAFGPAATPPIAPPAKGPIGKSCPCSPACECGCNAGGPCRCNPEGGVEPMTPPAGVNWVFGGVERYTLDGETVTREAVEAALADDSARLHLTVIGTPAEQEQLLAAIASDATRHHVQRYEPGHWALGVGFAAAPGGTVYLQRRDGVPLLRAEGPAGLVQKLRKADPTYRPEADPAGTPGLPSMDAMRPYLPWLAGGAALLVFLLVRSKGQAAEGPAPAPAKPTPALSPLDEAALQIGRQALARRADELTNPK